MPNISKKIQPMRAWPVKVIPASGVTLEVNFQLTADGAERVTLFGPAAHVFQGELVYRK